MFRKITTLKSILLVNQVNPKTTIKISIAQQELKEVIHLELRRQLLLLIQKLAPNRILS